MRGFTLVEVMVALLIMALVATASLKLVAMSERALAGVREKELLIDASSRVHMLFLEDPSRTSGVSDDIEWKVKDERKNPFADEKIDLDKLIADAKEGKLLGSKDTLKNMELRWRELTVTRKGASISIYLPPQDIVIGKQ